MISLMGRIKKMKGIMFFDDNLKEIKLPEVNKEAWDDFMSKV